MGRRWWCIPVNWGCGAFGGNRALMSMLQVLAAELAGVEQLVFHAVTATGSIEFGRAMTKVRRACPEPVLDTSLVLERIERMGLKWGTGDGNYHSTFARSRSRLAK